MILRKRKNLRLSIIGLFVGTVILYNEYLVYNIKAMQWPVDRCVDCIKILLVADPQLLGNMNEDYPGSWIARWDSDRFTAKTFSRALSHAQPDVIIFLGDLMDEGHIATDEDFIRYKQRFDYIFNIPENILKIFIPGDNDIGGEEDEVSSKFLNRFNSAFGQEDTFLYKNLLFFKINGLTLSIPKIQEKRFLNNQTIQNSMNVLLSHIPLFSSPSFFFKNVIKKFSPRIIFAAHNHKAMYVSYDTITNHLKDAHTLSSNNDQFYQLRTDMDLIYELQVPTCSYRMGTRHMGYGVVYINARDKSLKFAILWLPERFLKLMGYLICLGIVFCMLFRFWRC